MTDPTLPDLVRAFAAPIYDAYRDRDAAEADAAESAKLAKGLEDDLARTRRDLAEARTVVKSLRDGEIVRAVAGVAEILEAALDNPDPKVLRVVVAAQVDRLAGLTGRDRIEHEDASSATLDRRDRIETNP